MAKCVYTFLTYEESCPTFDMVQRLHEMGWHFAHSPVHNLDKLDKPLAGQEYKKAHVHWCVGFSSKPPKIDDFVEVIRKFGGVASAKSIVVRDPYSLLDYFTHSNTPEKHQYSADDCFYSQGWNLENYVIEFQRKEHQRKEKDKKRGEENAILCEILDMIGTSKDKCNAFQPLVDKVRKEKPLYFSVLLKNAYFIRSYLVSCVCEQRVESNLSAELDKQARIINDLSKENSDLAERLQFAEQSAACYYEQLFGESLPPSYEWSVEEEDNRPIENIDVQIGVPVEEFQ